MPSVGNSWPTDAINNESSRSLGISMTNSIVEHLQAGLATSEAYIKLRPRRGSLKKLVVPVNKPFCNFFDEVSKLLVAFGRAGKE